MFLYRIAAVVATNKVVERAMLKAAEKAARIKKGNSILALTNAGDITTEVENLFGPAVPSFRSLNSDGTIGVYTATIASTNGPNGTCVATMSVSTCGLGPTSFSNVSSL